MRIRQWDKLKMNNNNLTTFNLNAHSIRKVEINGEPWFVAADVCRVLGFTSTAGSGWFMRSLDSNEVNTITLTNGNRGNPHKKLISESGLYKLIMRSDKPEAKAFQDWVTKTVLPAIRKDGAYIMGEERVITGELTEEELVEKAISILRRKVDKQREEKAKQRIVSSIHTELCLS